MSSPPPGGRRWPLHPQPGPVEALSSWLARTAALYRLSVTELLRHDLGPASAQVTAAVLADLDLDPPAVVLAALAQRSGVEPAALRAMTLAGWVPWLTDTLTVLDDQAYAVLDDDGGADGEVVAVDAQELFDTYVRQHSVLLAPGEAGPNQVHRWRGPWLVAAPRWQRRVCPVCAAEPEHPAALFWQLPIMLGCVDHGCRLEPALGVELARVGGPPVPATPVDEHVAALDRYTYEGLTTGRVGLPGRSVHVGVWFRLLRALLDELTIAPSRLRVRSRAAVEHIWRVTARPVRAGLNVWRPFEQLDWPRQEAMLHAAAVALHLVADGAITARGTLGAALAIAPHRPVHEGDRPCAGGGPWARTREALDAVLGLARVDPGAARHLLRLLSGTCPTPARVERERHCLREAGVPAAFLVPADPT